MAARHRPHPSSSAPDPIRWRARTWREARRNLHLHPQTSPSSSLGPPCIRRTSHRVDHSQGWMRCNPAFLATFASPALGPCRQPCESAPIIASAMPCCREPLFFNAQGETFQGHDGEPAMILHDIPSWSDAHGQPSALAGHGLGGSTQHYVQLTVPASALDSSISLQNLFGAGSTKDLSVSC